MKRLQTAIILCALLTTGCSTFSRVSTESYPAGSTGRIFVWDSEDMAGVGRDDSMCVQGALTASAAAFNAAAKVAGEVDVGGGFSEKVVIINPASPQTTYASAAYFAICQLVMNSNAPEEVEIITTKNESGNTMRKIIKPNATALTGSQIVTMFAKASDSAVRISTSSQQNDPFSAPELVNYVQLVLAKSNIIKDADEIEEDLKDARKTILEEQSTALENIIPND